MSSGDDILIVRPDGVPAGQIARDAVLREVSEARGPSGAGRRGPLEGVSDAEIDEMLRQWEAEIETRAPPSEQAPRARAPSIGVAELEDIVAVAIGNVRARLGGQWLPARNFGTRLHDEVEAIIRQRYGNTAGWTIAAEQRIDDFAHVPQRVKDMTIREFVRQAPELAVYEDELGRIFRSLDSRVGDKVPDLVIRGQNQTIVWDLTARSTTEHLAKTLFYAHVLREGGQLVHIGETYWRHFARGFDPFGFYGATAGAGAAEQAGSSGQGGAGE